MRRRWLLIAGGSSFVALVACACGLSLSGTGEILETENGDGSPTNPADGSRLLTDDGATSVDAGDAQPADGAALDAKAEAGPAILCSPGVCNDAGGACDDAGACLFDCNVGNCGRITCPPKMPCTVRCGKNSCQNGIDCMMASSCDIACSGGGSCNGDAINCSGTSCTIACVDGGNECQLPISCDASACNIYCGNGPNTCTSPMTCIANSCSISCNAKAGCNPVLVIAVDASVSCSQDKNSCLDVSCYADAGKCVIDCDGGACANAVCCSGACTGNAGSGAVACGPP